MNKSKRIHERIRELTGEYRDQLKKDYPIGRHVSWKHGEQKRMGEVIDVAWDRVKLKSITSGKEFWIYAYRLCD